LIKIIKTETTARCSST